MAELNGECNLLLAQGGAHNELDFMGVIAVMLEQRSSGQVINGGFLE